MPSVQRGQVFKLPGGSWAIRYYQNGRRKQRGGFQTKSEAGLALASALRRSRLGPDALERQDWTVQELVDRYMAQHQAAPATLARLRSMLRKATDTFGDIAVRDLLPDEIGAWRMQIPEGHRHDATQALRQVLNAAVKWRVIPESPARHVRNPLPKREEIRPFETWADVEAVANELGPVGAVVIFAAATGLRPEEWLALEWRDVDLAERAVTVRRAYSGGALRDWGKTDRSRRRVPLRQKAVDVLEGIPRRIDTRLVFPALRGGYMNLHNFRAREWKPAVRAAGIQPERRIYDLRHTYATFSLTAGVSLFSLARRMGTSVDMIDRTYGHLALDAENHERELLDAFDAKNQTFGQLSGSANNE